MPETTNELREIALVMFDASEARLDDLEGKLPPPGHSGRHPMELLLFRESGRNEALRELLGKDNREDEKHA